MTLSESASGTGTGIQDWYDQQNLSITNSNISWKSIAARPVTSGYARNRNAEGDGLVEYVDANKISIKYDMTDDERLVSFDGDSKTYNLIKFRKTLLNCSLSPSKSNC